MPDRIENTLGVYISVPFCRSKCTYCNFASGVYPVAEHQRYVSRLIEDLTGAQGWASRIGAEVPHRVDTIYLGGGTPSLLAPALLQDLFAAIRSEFDVVPSAEITVECAPGQLADETLDAMAICGVNRVSLGVQSFVDREAAVSGRLHNRAAVFDDIRRLRAAGIANINLDLIAGLADQTLSSWDESLVALTESGIPHASVYMLEVDQDSRLGRELLAHGSRYHADLVPSDDAIARMYSAAIESLAAAGLVQYEISNFSRSGFASRHNLRYWERRPYLGIGLDASSALRAAASEPRALPPAPLLRATTTSDLKDYQSGAVEPEINWVSPAQQHEEAWFLGLRRNCGVQVADIEREFGAESLAAALDVVQRTVESGLLTFDGKTVRLTPQGQLLANNVFSEFLDLDAKTGVSLA
jgi:oxygen-independent coproporphyrinogen-3 oxidase